MQKRTGRIALVGAAATGIAALTGSQAASKKRPLSPAEEREVGELQQADAKKELSQAISRIRSKTAITEPIDIQATSRKTGTGKKVKALSLDDTVGCVISLLGIAIQSGDGLRLTATDARGKEIIKIETLTFESGTPLQYMKKLEELEEG